MRKGTEDMGHGCPSNLTSNFLWFLNADGLIPFDSSENRSYRKTANLNMLKNVPSKKKIERFADELKCTFTTFTATPSSILLRYMRRKTIYFE